MTSVILEDEALIARELRYKISKAAEDVEVIAHLDSIESAKAWLSQNPMPDLFFMDIQLGDGVSFDLFQSFSIQCPVIFTTAYDEYAVRAFRVNGADYLLKPVKEPELAAAIDKCRKLTAEQKKPPVDLQELIQSLSNPGTAAKYKEKFIVNIRNQFQFVFHCPQCLIKKSLY